MPPNSHSKRMAPPRTACRFATRNSPKLKKLAPLANPAYAHVLHIVGL